MLTATSAWLSILDDISKNGKYVSPRGKKTRECLQHTFAVDMLKPVVVNDIRKLSYRFMAAEAYWILAGDYRVETIAPYNKNISAFSDDGVTFAGAYGPRITSQMHYVVETLKNDPETRQAGLTIWNEKPKPSKDIPCTISIFFSLRNNVLNSHVFMRSSDVWLGVPYDIFNFSMLSYLVCGKLNKSINFGVPICPGTLYMTAMSRHLYEENFQTAKEVLFARHYRQYSVEPPEKLWQAPEDLFETLQALRETKKGDVLRWWENE